MSAQLSELPDPLEHPGPVRARERLGERLAQLRAAGVPRWDPPGFAYLTSLVARASRPEADARLISRAIERCEAMERWLEETQAEVARLDGIVDPADGVRAALDDGALAEAQVLAALASMPTPRSRIAPAERWRAATAQLETTLLEARTAAVTARAHAAGSETSGPYNPTALAGRLLARLDALAPGYLRTTVAALEDLAALHRRVVDAAPPRPKRSRPPRPPSG